MVTYDTAAAAMNAQPPTHHALATTTPGNSWDCPALPSARRKPPSNASGDSNKGYPIPTTNATARSTATHRGVADAHGAQRRNGSTRTVAAKRNETRGNNDQHRDHIDCDCRPS